MRSRMWTKRIAAVAVAVATVAWGAAAVAVPTVVEADPSTALGEGATPRAAAVPVEEWRVDPPAAHGMDAATLDQARQYAFVASRYTQGVVVARHGAVVAEWYADGADAGSWATSWSVGKSVSSALIGIAIGEGLIPSVDEPMTTYIPEWIGTDHESMTLRHVLEMTSGLAWSESYTPQNFATSDVIQMVAGQRDQLAYVVGRPQEVPPGTRFRYSSGDAMLLAGVIQKATGRSSAEYAREKLFDPLQIEQAEIWEDAEGHGLGYCCVDTTTRGFARIGQLFLQGGRWGDQQIIPADWVAASTAASRINAGYGFQWWRITVPGVPGTVIQARGHDGQYVYIVPELDLVVARNGRYHKADREAVADPNLFNHMPPQNLVAGAGTTGPSSWSDASFLGPIVASITESPHDAVTAHFSAAQCAAFDGLAAAFGTTRGEAVRTGVQLLAAYQAQVDGLVLPDHWNDEGPCEVTVSWSDEERAAVEVAAESAGVPVEELHHGGGRFLLGIIWALAASG